ncbi:S-adenosyl-L-methionine-dependent methyltransferase [Karstenula rhodostoma CBS 690.94]|uniref:S-adenosyl-L-methionine-dependent methyltransferase n=1 Tax=Karstenula rhodostoma CBS 690.94 TaxID=1392251 RepID=A0A9P4PD83_9PLEO|nr:S-adenosyl-L-methionine-dependent methyltransferase [Karstenula rhodostoma CBS 690.94]
MSLYYEAAAVLANSENAGGSLKSRIYKNRDLKASPAQLFALISEASKWSLVLKDVVERCGLLAEEKKLTPTLALLLTHDLLVAKSGIAAHANHVLKLAVLRHKARLSAEFTKARIGRGYATLDALREAVDQGELEDSDQPPKELYRHPRWVRVNTLRTSMEEQINTTFAGYDKASNIREVQRAPASAKRYFEDPHIPNLLALPPKADLTKSEAYAKGAIIFQDKASCFPAYLLDVGPDDGDAIDGCAAPGNKTTHLAAMLAQRNMHAKRQKVFAYERDKARTITLEKMVKRASADSVVLIKRSADFLAADPDSEEFAHVGAILLDPSCSGSGIVGRDDAVKMHLPIQVFGGAPVATSQKNKKRKRDNDASQANGSTTFSLRLDDTVPEETPVEGQLSERLTALSTFQLRMLMHAMRFPKASKMTYSTCSIHFEENEGVVFRALASKIARARGWRILPRDRQVQGMKDWNRRGVLETEKMDVDMDLDHLQKEEICNACIRCEKGTDEGTMGFFVAAFVRDAEFVSEGVLSNAGAVENVEEEEEWNGFSDGGETSVATPMRQQASTASKSLKKKRKQRRTMIENE